MTDLAATTYKRLPEDERRQSLIEATIRCLSAFGLSGTTVRKIAQEAEVAPNLITHHFSDKKTLIGATYRYLAEKYHRNYLAASEAAGTHPVDQLKAYIGSAFRVETLDPEILRVWTSFWTLALTDHDSIAARVHIETAGQTRAYLKQLLRNVLTMKKRSFDEPEIHDLAIAITSLVDGMWLTWGLDPNLFDAQRGRRIAFDMLASRLAIPEISDSAE
ncbi:MAG: TetR/AcrR family bet gene transcriptional repressor [Gammaproteobacteria bacterium]